MRKLLVVARHEYLTNVLRKSFLLTTFVLPLLLAAGFALLLVIGVRAGLRAESAIAVGYVDHSGLLAPLGERELIAGALGAPLPAIRYAEERTALAALHAGEIDTYFVVPADYLDSGEVTAYALERVPSMAVQRFESLLYQTLLTQIPEQDPRVAQPIASAERVSLDSSAAASQPGLSEMLAPLAFTALFLWTVFFASGYLIQSLIEEKQNRLMEILAASLRPGELMGGKILGLGLLGLTQLGVWLVGLGLILRLAAAFIPFLSLVSLSPGGLLLMVTLFLGGYLLFAATLSAVGAMISAAQEGGQLAGAVTLLALVPTWFIPQLVAEPHSALAVGLSLFPYTAPIALQLRMAGGSLPWWQVALSLALLIGCALAMVWAAGRVMRYGMLRYGKRVGLRELGRALRGS